jgi:ABC-2 type transport system ATP-binding protein
MKQKLGLVCVLIHHPELLVLDEPTTGVDPVSRRDFWAILTELLREQGITALVSTAYMEEATRFHRISLLHQGQTLARGQPDAILKQASGSLVVVEAQDQMKALKRLQENFSQVEALGPWLRVFVDQKNPESARRAVRSAIDEDSIRRVESAEPSLEDIFMALVRKHQEQGERSRQKETEDVYGGGAFEAEEGSAIRAENLVRAFDSFRAVDGVSFEVRHGEIFGLLGPNGAGKTTVIKMLTGIMPPSGGSGHVAGADMRGASRAIKNRIGYMSQVFSLYQDLSVLENIHLYAGVYGLGRREARERADWVVGLADLAGYEREHTGRLPMGMRQRLALGCALVHRPRILFLDEPTSGVDPAGRHQFWEILFRLSRRDKVTLLVTTHYMNEAEHCDRLALMHQGRIIASASPGEMKRRVEEDAGKLLEVEACPPLEALQILKDSGFESASLFGNRIHLLTPDPEASEPALRGKLQDQGMEVISVQRKPLTMEDVFVQHILSQEAEP